MSVNTRKRSTEAEEEDQRQYGPDTETLAELDEKYPDRPRNQSRTLPFSALYLSLLTPLSENKKPSGPASRPGRTRSSKISPQEHRHQLIERFIAHWRTEVGADIYPAFRLLIPDTDRDRGVYGLKENAIGKLLVKLLKIDKNSDDGFALLKWKLPGGNAAARMAGDFAGRCFEVLSKRQMRSKPGDMTVADVNELLDKLAEASGEGEMMPILEEFYDRMNAEEMMWLIRIILKQMKVGATARTFLEIWHTDAHALFNVSSSLRRVCWELYDPSVRIEEDKTAVTLMDCFQPQLAQFQPTSNFEKMVEKLNVPEEDPEYWIEEKLDGERMQMHVSTDPSVPGGKKFAFWSRKGKDYTYLYGSSFEDANSALSRHLKDAFVAGVRNLILDGEMITWDPELDKIMAFGTLKTAALSEQKNPYKATGPRPLFRVFDMLYLNGKDLTPYDLRTRHAAMTKAVPGVYRRLEIHTHETATTAAAIEPLLRKVVAEASEGLVLKNPHSIYQLNSRNNDWVKVKPEYMSEFGESLDCVVMGGYYGSGRRGGTLSSFLCGLRAGENHIQAGAAREKCFSFFKVGGGFRAEDYAEVNHHTEGKWQDWDSAHPPTQYIELGGGALQYENPDVWIRPSESLVIEVKAASVAASDQFAMGFTLRFPRFRRLRLDKGWNQGLDVDEFALLKREFEEKMEQKSMDVEERKRRPAKRVKREVVLAGTEGGEVAIKKEEEGGQDEGQGEKDKEDSKLFEGMEFAVLSDSVAKPRRTKAQLENLVKSHGGNVSQRPEHDGIVLVADKKVIKVASIMKDGGRNIVHSSWLTDCIKQDGGKGYLLPFEEAHLFHATDRMKKLASDYTDDYGDSYCRNVEVDELREVLSKMTVPRPSFTGGGRGEEESMAEKEQFLDQLEERGHGLGKYKGVMFRRCKVYFATGDQAGDEVGLDVFKLKKYLAFGGGRVGADVMDEEVTHVVVVDTMAGRGGDEGKDIAGTIRRRVCVRDQIPRIVSAKWVVDSFQEGTLLEEEGFKL